MGIIKRKLLTRSLVILLFIQLSIILFCNVYDPKTIYQLYILQLVELTFIIGLIITLIVVSIKKTKLKNH